MKKIKLYIAAIVVSLFFACEEQPDYLTKEGPFATFYPELSATLFETDQEEISISVEITSILSSDVIVYVKVPNDQSIITEPSYDPFTKEIPVTIPAGNRVGSFTLQYLDNDYRQDIQDYELKIVGSSDEINGSAKDTFTLRVIDNDFFSESFDNACELTDAAPTGWEVVSLSSEFTWGCSGDNRGASGEFGDYAFEMNNFGSPNAEPANDWLISPLLDLSNSDKIMSFSSMLRYSGTQIRILYSEDYEPGVTDIESATWVDIPEAVNALDTDEGSFDYVESGDLNLSYLPDEIYIAIQYTSVGAGSGESSIFRIDNFEIR